MRKINKIKDLLEKANSEILKLSDDLWLEIDHNNNDNFREFSDFKTKFNKQLQELNSVSNKLVELLKNSDLTKNESSSLILNKAGEQLTKTLHSDFTHEDPVAYIFQNNFEEPVRSWRDALVKFIRHLYKKDRQKIKDLVNNGNFISSKNNSYFSTNSLTFREPRNIDKDIYVEANLSANQIRDLLIKILKEFDYDKEDLLFKLRPKNPDLSTLTLKDLGL